MPDRHAATTSAFEAATPALCRLQLGSELRRLRIRSEKTAAEVSRIFSWSGSKLTRLETGDNGVVEPSDVIALCQVYDASAEERETLVGYATVTKTKKDWWQSPEVRDAIKPGFRAFLGLEAIAEKIETYEAEYVPGLFQTEEYIRAIHEPAHAGLAEELIDRLVAVRVTRQAGLRREDAALELHVIINEAVLRRRVGSVAIMRSQLSHMAELADCPHVKLQVVPFSLGEHPGMNGSFQLLQFSADSLKPIVYVENLVGAGVSRREDEVKQYEAAFSDLRALAPGYQESQNMIRTAIKELG